MKERGTGETSKTGYAFKDEDVCNCRWLLLQSNQEIVTYS